MIRLPDRDLSSTTSSWLARWQRELDEIASYSERVESARTKWKQRWGTKTLREIRKTLQSMCSGARRCCYCEDSYADEIEHVRPKSLYPESCFKWLNMLFVCAPCNRAKRDKFAVFPHQARKTRDVTRKPGHPVVPPIQGKDAFIDPRTEDPTDFLSLDLTDTFFIVPKYNLKGRARARAKFTIKTLRLNSRDVLPIARQRAYEDYKDRLLAYIQRQNAGASPVEIKRRKHIIQTSQHPFVWFEMKRQHNNIKELSQIFQKVQNVSSW